MDASHRNAYWSREQGLRLKVVHASRLVVYCFKLTYTYAWYVTVFKCDHSINWTTNTMLSCRVSSSGGGGGKLPSQNTQLPPQKEREKEGREGGRGEHISFWCCDTRDQ
jgi:hypothetical protein